MGVLNGNWRDGIYTGYGQNTEVREIDRLAIELEHEIGKQSAWEFARDLQVKGTEARTEAYRAKLAEVKAAELSPVEIMQAQLATLEAALSEPIEQERANEIYLQMVELQAAIEKEDGAINDYYDGRVMARNLSDTY